VISEKMADEGLRQHTRNPKDREPRRSDGFQ
jgi:hypothetical protein